MTDALSVLMPAVAFLLALIWALWAARSEAKAIDEYEREMTRRVIARLRKKRRMTRR